MPAARSNHGLLAATLATVLTTAPFGIPAQSASTSYQIPRQTIDAGAGRATSTSFAIDAILGQPDAGAVMTSPSYSLRGGFHVAAPSMPAPDTIFADGYEAP